MMMSDPHNEWHDRFLKESEENAKLRRDLEETRAKFDSLLEASLQQMASRIDEYSANTAKINRMSPTNNPLNPITTSSNNLNSHAPPLSVSISDDTHPLSDKKATPKKKKEVFGGFSIFKKDRKDAKDIKGGACDPEDPRSDFVIATSPSTPYQHLPRLKVLPLAAKNHVVISGPNGPVGPVVADESGSAHYSDIVAGRSISTYPHVPGNQNRDGDPIADKYAAHVFENRIIASVADGCNWGPKPREAAQKANSAFIEYINQYHDTITDVKKAGGVLLSAFEHAHNSIMEGKLAFWDAGTTTLLGGVLLEINKTEHSDNWTPRWEFVCASVGDCKAFCYSNGEISDITHGNRQNASDPRDCGGRLGPHLDEGKPDLRNLNLFCAPCMDGDLIIIVTDGVHDNLDPQHLGRVPKDMSKEYNLAGDKWEDVDSAKAVIAKNAYTTELLLRLLRTGEEMPTPKEVADRLIAHCIEVTQKSRQYMEDNNGKRLPEDYIEYPGKMDHTTCLCFRVGRFPSLPEKGNITAGSTQVPSLSMSSSSLLLTPSIPNSSPTIAIATSTAGAQISKQGQEDDSPRVGSPTSSNLASPKLDNWTKITPSTKHS